MSNSEISFPFHIGCLLGIITAPERVKKLSEQLDLAPEHFDKLLETLKPFVEAFYRDPKTERT